MQYRSFPGLDWKPSALGFGAMRLPVIGDDQNNVDFPEAVRMIRYAIDHGVNYLDTAYFYHGGNSEKAVGLALRDGYRDRIKLATKFPAWQVKTRDDFDAAFEQQLERLQTDKIDFYLLHGLHPGGFERLRDLGIIPWLEDNVARGRLEYLGFSFHGDYEYFTTIVDAYDNWTFCQVQYNYMDEDYQAGTRGVKYAAEKGLGIIVMEPLRGGRLTGRQTDLVAAAWKTAHADRSPAEWGLRWVWSHPEVSFLLSGMSTMEQVRENIDIADRAGNSAMTADDLALIDRVRQAYLNSMPIPCTGCRYCMPCPQGVEIPRIFNIYSEMKMYGEDRIARMRYTDDRHGLKPEQRGDNCIECWQCVDRCPQHLPIPEWLSHAHKELEP